MDFGEKLFELRKAKNLTQDDVAEKINVTRQTVSKWETNQSTPDFDKILPLCELYEISADELLKGEKSEVEEENNSEEIKKSIFKREKEEIDYDKMTPGQIKQKNAEVLSSSILIFFFAICFMPISVAFLKWSPVFCVGVFIMLVGFGVAKIVKHFMAVPKLEKTAKEIKQDKVVKQITDIIMGITVALYFIVSFATMAWYITWLMFIIGDLICKIVRLIFTVKEEDNNEE